MTPLSPLELLHPDGRIETVAVLGEDHPPALVPARATEAQSNVELALVAPSPAELDQPGWLTCAIERATSALGEQGLVYALLPGRARRRTRALLRRAGLTLEPPLVHLPDGFTTRYIVPLSRRPWRYALGRAIAAQPASRRALLLARSLPGGEGLLARALPTVAVVARRPQGRPLGAWVARFDGVAAEPAAVVVAVSFRGPGAGVVVHCFPAGASRPSAVAKVAPDAVVEADRVQRAGPGARTAGARVPEALASGEIGGRPVNLQTPIAGRPAAAVLSRAPGRLSSLAEQLTAWLERWHSATAVRSTLERKLLEVKVLRPAAELAPQLACGSAYRKWLERRCRRLAGSPIPLVAQHGDLTMWNVVLDESERIGVLDWADAADEGGLPLTDFFYAIADATLAARDCETRATAVRACFLANGQPRPSIAPLQARLSAALAVSAPATELCFHACWLHHARNEQAAVESGESEFLRVVEWLAGATVGQGA